jgi:hypothetical protein
MVKPKLGQIVGLRGYRSEPRHPRIIRSEGHGDATTSAASRPRARRSPESARTKLATSGGFSLLPVSHSALPRQLARCSEREKARGSPADHLDDLRPTRFRARSAGDGERRPPGRRPRAGQAFSAVAGGHARSRGWLSIRFDDHTQSRPSASVSGGATASRSTRSARWRRRSSHEPRAHNVLGLAETSGVRRGDPGPDRRRRMSHRRGARGSTKVASAARRALKHLAFSVTR